MISQKLNYLETLVEWRMLLLIDIVGMLLPLLTWNLIMTKINYYQSVETRKVSFNGDSFSMKNLNLLLMKLINNLNKKKKVKKLLLQVVMMMIFSERKKLKKVMKLELSNLLKVKLNLLEILKWMLKNTIKNLKII